MSDIQRWNRYSDALDMFKADEGDWVTYSDHVAAVAEAEQRIGEGRCCPVAWQTGYEQALADAVAAVEALAETHANVSQKLAIQFKREVIAAIKAVGE